MSPKREGVAPFLFFNSKLMIRLNEIKKALKRLVGWEKPNGIHSDTAWDAVTQSESGLVYNDAHPLMTTDNIMSVMSEDFYLRYPEFVTGISYEAGEKVRVGKAVYVCTTPTTDNPASSADWSEFPVIIDYLQNQTDKGITQMVQRFLADKTIAGESKSLLERRTAFDGAGRINATLENRHKIVGFEIVPVRSMGVTTKIERIGFQGVGGTGTIRMYVFHSSQTDPVYVEDLNYQKTNGGFQWFVPSTPIYLPYISETNDSGGAWLLCYNQDDLPQGLEAINVSKDWSREPCGTCNIGSLETWREITKYLQISPFCYNAPTTFAEFPEIPDVAYLNYTNTTNYGLNIEISVGCDLTDFIISQRSMFANALQLQVAYNVLRTMAMNPDVRVNRNQSNVSRMDILYELDGNTQGRQSGLGYELEKTYKALSIDTRGLDRVCLTCNNHGVKYRTI